MCTLHVRVSPCFRAYSYVSWRRVGARCDRFLLLSHANARGDAEKLCPIPATYFHSVFVLSFRQRPSRLMTVSRKDAGVEHALPWSSAAKRLVHDLIGPRRIDVAAEGRLILVRHGEHRQQTLEGREISVVHGCGYRLLHQMVARDESRVSRTHRRPTLVRLSTLLRKPIAPSRRPIVEGSRIGKQSAHTRVAVGTGNHFARASSTREMLSRANLCWL